MPIFNNINNLIKLNVLNINEINITTKKAKIVKKNRRETKDPTIC